MDPIPRASSGAPRLHPSLPTPPAPSPTPLSSEPPLQRPPGPGRGPSSRRGPDSRRTVVFPGPSALGWEATGAEWTRRSPPPGLAPMLTARRSAGRGPHALASPAAWPAPAHRPDPAPSPPLHPRPGLGRSPSGPEACPSPFTCSIAGSGTPLNRLSPLRVHNRTRRLLEPTRSCRDPRIPPLPLLLTGRTPLRTFCASLLLALFLVHHPQFSLIGQLGVIPSALPP